MGTKLFEVRLSTGVYGDNLDRRGEIALFTQQVL
jgi:hypothetical protein